MNFEDLIAKVKTCGKQKLAVAAAEDDAVLEAVDAAHKQGIADAILVGDEAAIRKIAAELNIDLSDYEIINEPDKVQASLKAVKLAHDGVANMYMKGLLDTKTFLKSVLDKEVGLRTGNTLSHVAVFEVKGIEQLLFLTDVAFMTYPTLEDKVHIIENTVAVAHACGVAGCMARPLQLMVIVFKPFIWFSSMLTRLVASPQSGPSATEDDIRAITSLSRQTGRIQQYEENAIRNILSLDVKHVREIMTPRTMVFSLQEDISVKDAYNHPQIWHYSRIPVYGDDNEDIVGIVLRKDIGRYVSQGQGEKTLFDIMQPVRFVLENQTVDKLLLEFLESRLHLFIVLDEYGATVGMITLEDLLEEIVGDIRDEYDHDEEDPIRRIQENEYQVLGSSKLDDLNEKLGIHLESEDYDSIGGYIIEHLDHLPKAGEFIVTEDGIRLVVDTVTRKRIDRVHIYLPPKKEEDETEENYL